MQGSITVGLEGHEVRIVETDLDGLSDYSDAILDVYEKRLDGVLIRGAFPEDVVRSVADRLRTDSTLPWLRPNRELPGGDIHLLGLPATPTRESLTGPPAESYAESAGLYPPLLRSLFPADCDPIERFRKLIGRISGGRPVEVPMLDGEHAFAPCNLRSLAEGQGIAVHNDNHFYLKIYDPVRPLLDTSVSLSYFLTVQQADSGGELVVYGLHGDDPNQPRMPSGLIDATEVSRRFVHTSFDTRPGDVIVFGSGRSFHHVENVRGPSERITMGGFISLGRDRDRVMYWS